MVLYSISFVWDETSHLHKFSCKPEKISLIFGEKAGFFNLTLGSNFSSSSVQCSELRSRSGQMDFRQGVGSPEYWNATLEPFVPSLLCSWGCRGPSFPLCVFNQQKTIMSLRAKGKPDCTDDLERFGRFRIFGSGMASDLICQQAFSFLFLSVLHCRLWHAFFGAVFNSRSTLWDPVI